MNSAPPETTTQKARRLGGFAALVAAGIFLSRIAGLIRTRVFAHYLGSSRAADAFNVALKIPNLLQNLFGEGVLSASFIPVYAKLVAEGDEELAGRVAGVFVSLLTLGVSILVLLGILFAPLILQVTAPGFEGPTMDLTVTLVRIIFPGVGLLVIAAWCQGVLNTHRRFFLSYVAPVLWNASMIAALVIFGMRGVGEVDLAVALAWGTTIGCALQLAIQLPAAIRLAKHLRLGLDRRLPQVREIFRNIAPVIGGRGVVQISGYIDQLIATLLPIGSVANLAYAQTIYMLPISLFGMSVAAAELPEMSRHTGTDEEIATALRQRLARGLRQIAFFVVPTVVAFIAIGRILVAALYQTGKFGPELTRLVWYILIGSSIGLLVATLGRLYSSAFYALRDTRTPFRFALARVIVGASLGATLAFPLRHLIVRTIEFLGGTVPDVPGGPAAVAVIGITAASGVAAWVEFLLLRRGLHRRIGKIEIPISFHVRLWASAIIAGIAAVAFDRFVARSVALRLPLPYISEAIAVAGLFGLAYFAATMVVGVPESRATIGRFIRR